MIFDQSVNEIDQLVEKTEEVEFDGEVLLNPTYEVSLIGLCAYFEAFFKDQFASVINICPQLLTRFVRNHETVSLHIPDLLITTVGAQCRLGFLLAEQFDFGSAKKINALFNSLLIITPFSKDESSRYDELLHDRNLLVHHGGIFTLQYAAKRFGIKEAPTKAFSDSVLIKKADCLEWSSTLRGIVIKTTDACADALEQHIADEAPDIHPEQERAVLYLRSFDHKKD